jgi:hypothetical protein
MFMYLDFRGAKIVELADYQYVNTSNINLKTQY